MKHLLFTLAVIFGLTSMGYGQFAFNIIGSRNEAIGLGTDRDNNTYLAGSFSGTINFGTEEQPLTLTAPPTETWGYIAKYDSNGGFQWAFALNAGVSQIVTDQNGNVFLFGAYSGTTVFDPGIGKNYLQTFGADYYIASYDKNGDFRFVYGGGSIYDYHQVISSIDLSETGDLYVFGLATGAVDINLSDDKTAFTASDNGSLYAARYSSSGQFEEALKLVDLGKNSAIRTSDLSILGKDGNIYIAGYSASVDDFDPSQDTVTLLDKTNLYYFYLSSYSINGKLRFAHLVSDSITQQRLVDLDANSEGIITLAGTFYNPLTVSGKNSSKMITPPDNLSAHNGFVVSYNQSQEIEYAVNVNTQIKKDIFDQSNLIIKDLKLSETGNVFLTGVFTGMMDLDPGEKQNNHYSVGEDVFLVSYDQFGQLNYAHSLVGSSQWEEGQAIALAQDEKLFLAGTFGSRRFDVATGEDTFFLKSYQPSSFVVSYSTDGSFEKDTTGTTTSQAHLFHSNAKIYPNPTKGKIEITIPSADRCAKVQIISSSGKMLAPLKLRQHSERIYVDCIDLEPGVYWVRLICTQGRYIARFIKQ